MNPMKKSQLRAIVPIICLLAVSCACSDGAKEEFKPVDGGGSGGTTPTEKVVWHERAYETFGAIDRSYRVASGATAGFYNMPAVVCNYYIPKVHLKLSAMYQFTGRWGHDTQLDRDNDDLGISTHYASLQAQFSF